MTTNAIKRNDLVYSVCALVMLALLVPTGAEAVSLSSPATGAKKASGQSALPWITRAEEIRSKTEPAYHAKLREIRVAAKRRDVEAEARALNGAMKIFRGYLNKLRAIPRPPEDAEAISSFLNVKQEVIKALEVAAKWLKLVRPDQPLPQKANTRGNRALDRAANLERQAASIAASFGWNYSAENRS
jgi:hypothetical protein